METANNIRQVTLLKSITETISNCTITNNMYILTITTSMNSIRSINASMHCKHLINEKLYMQNSVTQSIF